jgi:hypothetical protein
MDKLNEFKEFIKDKSFLQEKVNKGETTWQKLYETYDLFGKEADVFKQEKTEERNSASQNQPNSLLKMLEGVNLDKINENLEGMKKILGVLGEFTRKEEPKVNRRSTSRTPRGYDD